MNARQRWSINGRFLAQTQTGVQRYAREITRAIDGRLASNEALSRTMQWEICLPSDVGESPRFDAIEVRRSPVGRGYVWEQAILPMMARGGILSLANLGPLTRAHQIICLHDANVFLEPASYSRNFRLAYRAIFPLLARRARAVTTVSRFSAQMLEVFGVTGDAMPLVVPNGHEHALRWHGANSRFSAADAFSRPYVFALGSRAKHKQIDLLLGLAPALDALGLDLVISGAAASIFTQTVMQAAPNVHLVGFVEDDDLAALFSRALCFAFPSRTEGFGLPLLEAMVHGAPILASHCASMPEVCGDAALYAATDDPAAWLEAIARLKAAPELRADLIERGRARFPTFSWMRSADLYLELAQSLAARRISAPHSSSSARDLRRPAR